MTSLMTNVKLGLVLGDGKESTERTAISVERSDEQGKAKRRREFAAYS